MAFELHILGNSSALPAYGRHPSAHFLIRQGQGFLIDCGEGTQMQMQRYGIKWGKLDYIFISHLHGDHYFGLVGMLTSLSLLKREKPMHVYGPQGLEEIIMTHFKFIEMQFSFPLHFHVVNPKKHVQLMETKHVTVHSLPLKHRIPCCGFLFREKPYPRKILSHKIEQHGVLNEQIGEIKYGADFVKPDGTLVPNSELTGPPPPSKSYAYCSDTLFHEELAELVQGVDLLYHEATFGSDKLKRASETMHSTAAQAGQLAKLAKAHKLIIGHFSSRYVELEPLLEEARSEFANTELAVEGLMFDV